MINPKDGRQYRSFDLRPEGGKIEGYAVVFDQPTVIDTDPYTGVEFYEVIERGALDGCDMSDVVLNVDHEGTPIARTKAGNLTLSIDSHGLKVAANLTTSRGGQVWEDIAAGNLNKMSFAFSIGTENYDRAARTRNIQSISKLWDVSVVTRPAYDQTCVFARASMAGRMDEERRAFVAGKLATMRTVELPEAPEMRSGIEWAGMENDIAKHKELVRCARELTAWEPKGDQEDVTTVKAKSDSLNGIIKELESQIEAEQRRIQDVETRRVQFYGWRTDQLLPSTKEQIKALALRGIPLKLAGRIPQELRDYYDEINPRYHYGETYSHSERGYINMNDNIEIRALQSYLCKGVSQMDEDERRALTTTGGGAAIIPTEVADRIIMNAGYSILTDRANRFADGRRGKLVVPTAIPSGGGVGWHEEMDPVTPYDQTLGSVAIEGMELVKIIAASKSMETMAVDAFSNYIIKLLSGELLDVLERAYITGKKGTSGPADGLDNLALTDRTITGADGITLENIASAIAKLPAKVQHNALVMGNATTLAGILTTKGSYAFDVRSTLKDMGVELVQNPHIADNVIYAVGDPQQSLFLNFWQPISVDVNEAALFMNVAIAIRALAVVGFAWVPEYVAKVQAKVANQAV